MPPTPPPPPPPPPITDVCVIGAGAAGLMAAIHAARALPRTDPARPRVVAIDGARSLGAKILVAGGGRCNVTHDHVTAAEYAGSTTPAIRKVLRRFDVPDTVAFFESLGVTLKREDTGKLFPTTDKARTVLGALLNAARDAGVEIRFPVKAARVVRPNNDLFHVEPDDHHAETIGARRVIIATGGKSLPKSGSDGSGYPIVRSLGHTTTERIFPALVALTIGPDDPARLRELAGISHVATLEVRAPTGKRLKAITGSTLCTHFGLSGPGPMDISRFLTDARLDDPPHSPTRSHLVINWLPGTTPEAADAELLDPRADTCGRWLREHPTNTAGPMATRLAETICRAAGVEPTTPVRSLRKDQRRALVQHATAMPVPISGDRGWNGAEVTAGGVPLAELDLNTMQSRRTPGLFLCGEICDVDGRIGGYNFQWAWASGFIAGTAAAASLGD